MDIVWFGQSMFKIKGKTATIIIDPYDSDFTGLKLPKDLDAQIVLATHDHKDHNNTSIVSGNPLIIKGPGEYEKIEVQVNGITSYHDDVQGSQRGKNTIYNILMERISIIHLGDLGHVLTDAQTSQIDEVDILMIPVGSTYTINAEVAVQVVAQLEPKIVIPMHYKIPDLKIELEGVEAFLKEMGTENLSPVPKLSITRDKLPEETTLVLLDKY